MELEFKRRHYSEIAATTTNGPVKIVIFTKAALSRSHAKKRSVPTLVPKPESPTSTQGDLPRQESAAKRVLGLP